MINLKAEYEEMLSAISDESQQEVYKLRVLKADSPILFAGINTGNMSRQLYIDLGIESWNNEQVRSLPKWRGLSIKVEYYEKLATLKGHYFLVLRQESDNGTEMTEIVLQNVVEHLIMKDDREPLFSVVYKVLERWRMFFQRGGYRKLSEEQQRGLFGELWYMKEWLIRFPNSPPLIVDKWEGPTSGRIDYTHLSYGVEIKTSTNKLTKTIKISSENQLRLTETVSTIYIYVCFIDQSRTHGITLKDLVNEVRTIISSRSDRLLLKFNDLLEDLRFKEVDYNEDFYFIDKIEVYEADNNFPRITKEDLPIGISHVSYSIDLTHCGVFERELDTVFSIVGD